MKRLRFNTGVKIRYFACGEYGEKTHRPHYHAIIFGYDWSDKKKYATNKRGDIRYKSKQLNQDWGLGDTEIGSVTPDSCGYVARYLMKKITGQMADDHYTRVNEKTGEIYKLVPEYINMSTKPAIGMAFFDKFQKEILKDDSVIVKGKKRKVPKAYDRKIGKTDPILLEDIKYARSEKARERATDNTDERLRVREEVKKAQINPLKRDL